MDPLICCVLGICCPPASEGQLEAFVKALEQSGIAPERAKVVAMLLRADLTAFSQKVAEAVK